MNATSVDDYLDELFTHLRGTPAAIRRILQETQAHLDDGVAAGIDEGLSPADAHSRAIARFGPAKALAHECNRSAHGTASPLRHLATQLAALVGVGFVAIGVSGIVALAMIATKGKTFVFGDAAGTRYSAADCQHWLAVQPRARTCAQAALAESVADGLLQRLALGVLGLVLLTALWAVRRRIGTTVRDSLTSPFAALVATGAFGGAGTFLLANGIDTMRVFSGHGAGQWLSGGIVALVVGFAFGVILVRRITDTPAVLRAPAIATD